MSERLPEAAPPKEDSLSTLTATVQIWRQDKRKISISLGPRSHVINVTESDGSIYEGLDRYLEDQGY